MHPVLHRLALLVRARVRSSMSPGLQSYPTRITSPTQPTQGARQGSHTLECTSRGRQVPTLGRLREGAVGAAADAQGSGVHAAPDSRRHSLQHGCAGNPLVRAVLAILEVKAKAESLRLYRRDPRRGVGLATYCGALDEIMSARSSRTVQAGATRIWSLKDNLDTGCDQLGTLRETGVRPRIAPDTLSFNRFTHDAATLPRSVRNRTT